MRQHDAQSRVFCPIQNLEVRDSGAGDGSYTLRGHFAVFNRLSLDLGGFREKIDPGAFTNVLARGPACLCVWDHDTARVLANTDNGTLELKESPGGLEGWARVAPTSYAADLRVLLDRGDISQASFMFTIERERWETVVEEGKPDVVVATIEEIGELYDVTVTGRGAYPQTDVSLAALAKRRLDDAITSGHVEGRAEGSNGAPETGSEGAAPIEAGTDEATRNAHAVRVEEAKRRRAGAGSPEGDCPE